MKIAEQNLKTIGYDVVPIKFDQKVFEDARTAFMGCVAQGFSAGTAKDFFRECETMLKPLQNNIMIMTASPLKRALIDFLLKNVLNKPRGFEQLNGLRVRSPEDFEHFLKFRYEFNHQMG